MCGTTTNPLIVILYQPCEMYAIQIEDDNIHVNFMIASWANQDT